MSVFDGLPLMAAACTLAGVAGVSLAGWLLERRRVQLRRQSLRQGASASESAEAKVRGLAEVVVRYVVSLSGALSSRASRTLIPRRNGRHTARSKEDHAATWFGSHVGKAGLASEVTLEGYREVRVRLALGFAAVGGLVGAVLSNELALLLGACGAVVGAFAPRWALRAIERERAAEVERHLSEMLEVVALGLRSGLSFDRSFELYSSHFDSSLAQGCISAQRRWTLGLTTRDEALRALAATYDSGQLTRVVDNVVRALRFGSSLAESLEAAAAEARADHRAHVEEMVAKAPVKMMMPTGALILPAMLLLVLGPVLLELAEGF